MQWCRHHASGMRQDCKSDIHRRCPSNLTELKIFCKAKWIKNVILITYQCHSFQSFEKQVSISFHFTISHYFMLIDDIKKCTEVHGCILIKHEKVQYFCKDSSQTCLDLDAGTNAVYKFRITHTPSAVH
ncbi:hypothetical protein XENOCAPTIV_015432 [Xenoophorus captivus]|uniref:Uncharacterized protein n=1 Tax=Xenoophorus captivus TaxID=1517983 RepID=A0ABV0QM27_9TELE